MSQARVDDFDRFGDRYSAPLSPLDLEFSFQLEALHSLHDHGLDREGKFRERLVVCVPKSAVVPVTVQDSNPLISQPLNSADPLRVRQCLALACELPKMDSPITFELRGTRRNGNRFEHDFRHDLHASSWIGGIESIPKGNQPLVFIPASLNLVLVMSLLQGINPRDQIAAIRSRCFSWRRLQLRSIDVQRLFLGCAAPQ